ncbi:hypothetical protein V491_00266 [Pseudogymnoascus sp. VKM F-3775]|nr:hypothetical protein V491_00266 [Pseudogymnoascus sp. VKM F-3775]
MQVLIEIHFVDSPVMAVKFSVTDNSSTNHLVRDATSMILAIRFIRQRVHDQEATSGNPELSGSPTRWPTIGRLRTQGLPGPSQPEYQLQALSSPSTPCITPPEQLTGMPGDSSNDVERNNGWHSVAAGNMASFSYTLSEAEEQLPKYIDCDHDLPDYTDQSEIPVQDG